MKEKPSSAKSTVSFKTSLCFIVDFSGKYIKSLPSPIASNLNSLKSNEIYFERACQSSLSNKTCQ